MSNIIIVNYFDEAGSDILSFSLVGTSDLLHSFFANIAYHLENKNWGSKFPKIMNELYLLTLFNHVSP